MPSIEIDSQTLSTVVVEVEIPPDVVSRHRTPAALPRLERIPPQRKTNRTQPPGNGTSVGGNGTEADADASDPWAPRRRILRGHIARGRALFPEVQRGKESNVDEMAVREGMTPCRLRQLLYLLKLAPEILVDIEDPKATGPVPKEDTLRWLVSIWPLENQVAEYRRVIGRGPAESGCVTDVPNQRSFRPSFDRARRYRAALDNGEVPSIDALCKRERVSSPVLCQHLALLRLEPEIIAALDQEVNTLPAWVNENRLRALGRIRDREKQLQAWRALIGEKAPSGQDG